MPLVPGDIVQNAKVTYLDSRGRWWVKGQGFRGFVEPNCLPPHGLSKGKVLDSLVVLPKRRSHRLALCNFEKSLVSYYYERKPGRPIEAVHSDVWTSRWRSGAKTPPEVMCCQCPSEGWIPFDPYNEWAFATCSGWVMPVRTSKHWRVFRGPRLYCPTALVGTKSFKHLLSVCYGADTTSRIPLPLVYEAEICLEGNPPEQKKVTIFFHGHLFPPKWHHGIWKHMMSGAPSAVPVGGGNERDLWEAWLGTALPPPTEVNELFSKCQENPEGKGCRPCPPEHFAEVDERIRKFRNQYLQLEVTLFESGATKEVRMGMTPWGFLEVEVVIIGEEIRSQMGRGVRGFPYLALWGWSYDWSDPETRPTLNLAVRTFFMKRICFPRFELRGADARSGRIENVARKP